MKRIFALLCCFTLCSIAGLAQKKSSKSAMSDQQFVDFAGQNDMVDANLGQLAKTATSSQNIKDYAQKVVLEQTDDFRALWKAARSTSLLVPDAIDKERDQTTIDPIQKLRNATFDRRFVKEMIDGDKTAIDIYKKEVAHTQAAALRSYVEEALPVLQAHLAQARKMETAKTAKKRG